MIKYIMVALMAGTIAASACEPGKDLSEFKTQAADIGVEVIALSPEQTTSLNNKVGPPPVENYDELDLVRHVPSGHGQILVVKDGCITAQTGVLDLQTLMNVLGSGEANGQP